MNKFISRSLLAAAFFLMLGMLRANATESLNLPALSAGDLVSLSPETLQTEDPLKNTLPRPATLEEQDNEQDNLLTPAQWDEVFSREQDDTRELFSDFSARYVVNGTLQLESTPPTFTTLSGKIFTVVKYPTWLRGAGKTRLCVEGYIKQQDDTSKLSITTVLPLDEEAVNTPSSATLALQKQSFILSKNSQSYKLANVNWGVQHSADGERLKQPDGLFKFVWPKSVTVKPELLEAAYVGKKNRPTFPYVGVHAFLAFKFKPGGVTDDKGNMARGLVISVNTYSKVPGIQNQGIVDGVLGNYVIHYNINSAEGYVEQNIFTDSNRISLYPLNLSRDRQVQLLKIAILQATDNRTGEMYSLIYNSCTNAVISFINSVLSGSEKIVDGWMPELVYRLRATIPDTATVLLRKRGLIEKPLPYLDENNYTRVFDK